MRGTSTSKRLPLRRIGAALACLLWVLGFEVGPSLHVWLHEEIGHHHHAGDGVASHADEDHDHAREHEHEHGHDHVAVEHHHDDVDHHHEHDDAEHHAHDDVDHHAHDDVDHHAHDGVDHHAHDDAEHHEHDDDVGDEASCRSPGHGAHALAHRAMVVTPTDAPWPAVAVAPLSFFAWPHAPRAAPSDRTPRHVRARGPPSIG